MKIKNNNKARVELKDAFKIGDRLRLNVGGADGRGGWNDDIIYVILTKINKVTAIGVLEDTDDEVTLDWNDLYYAEIVEVKEVLRKNLLKA